MTDRQHDSVATRHLAEARPIQRWQHVVLKSDALSSAARVPGGRDSLRRRLAADEAVGAVALDVLGCGFGQPDSTAANLMRATPLRLRHRTGAWILRSWRISRLTAMVSTPAIAPRTTKSAYHGPKAAQRRQPPGRRCRLAALAPQPHRHPVMRSRQPRSSKARWMRSRLFHQITDGMPLACCQIGAVICQRTDKR